jgi:hypothetical protein
VELPKKTNDCALKKVMIFLLLIVTTASSQACDCDSIKESKDAKSVFSGKVLSVTRIDSPFVRYKILFKVSTSIKGHVKAKNIVVNVSCLQDGCCGLPFKQGEWYVIYTYIRNNMLYTGYCTETHKL